VPLSRAREWASQESAEGCSGGGEPVVSCMSRLKLDKISASISLRLNLVWRSKCIRSFRSLQSLIISTRRSNWCANNWKLSKSLGIGFTY
jgi:hypothetical protein